MSLDYTYTHREQEKEVVPSKGVHEYAVKVVRRFVEQLGYNEVILKSDNEPATLASKRLL